MIVIVFTPLNDAASRAFVRTQGSGQAFESGLRRALPEMFSGDIWGSGPIPEATMAAIEARCGELSPITRACLRNCPRLSIHAKDGKVCLYLHEGTTLEYGQIVADAAQPILRAASLTEGRWRASIRLEEQALGLHNNELSYRVARLELPVPEHVENDDLPWVEDHLRDALYASVINLAIASDDPHQSVAYLPRKRALHVAATGELVERLRWAPIADHTTAVYTGVRIESNLRTQGPIFTGFNSADGNGLLEPINGW